MEFTGFAAEDFDLFAIPDFAGRMAAIREHVKPKLGVLGAALTPAVHAATGVDTYPHVAQHMRRRVNPPVETWVAFGRDRKGYKRWTHYRLAVSGAGVRVTVFVEDDADDKAAFGAALESGSRTLLRKLGKAGVRWDGLEGKIDAERLAAHGRDLQRLKTLKFQAGVPLPREEALRLDGPALEEWARTQVGVLAPLYLMGVPK